MRKQPFFRNMRMALGRLQRADDSTKRRWFLGGAAITTVLVFSVWIGYLGTSISPNKTPRENDPGSFSETFKRGMENIATDVGKKYEILKKNIDANLKLIERTLTETNTISIEGGDETPFVPAELENVPETPLP